MLLAGAFAMWATPASAAIIYTDLGTAAPPATLGGYTMIAFPDDPRAEFSDVNDVAAPGGGTVDFDSTLDLRAVPTSWSTWSHGYTGDVYFTNGLLDLTLTLPTGTGAFYLYVEPDPFSPIEFNVCSAATCSGPVIINGTAGATGFGFHGTGGDEIAPEPRALLAHAVRQGHVLAHGQSEEQLELLERAGQAPASALRRRPVGRTLPGEEDVAFLRAQQAGQHPEEGGLAGTVGSDEPDDARRRDRHAHIAQRDEAPEPHRDVASLDHTFDRLP